MRILKLYIQFLAILAIYVFIVDGLIWCIVGAIEHDWHPTKWSYGDKLLSIGAMGIFSLVFWLLYFKNLDENAK